MRRIPLVACTYVIMAMVMFSPSVRAKMNPLRLLTYDLAKSRAEVIIALDASKSVAHDFAGNTGAGCNGPQPTLDLDGDGLCTGAEKSAPDCIACSNASKKQTPGMCRSCKNNPTDPARNFLLKRSMAVVLPEFRTLASFGLLTFPYHTGYYQYNLASTASSKGVSLFIYERELKEGGWINPNAPATTNVGWDTSAGGPQATFTVNGVTYHRLDQTASSGIFPSITVDKDSLYRRCTGHDAEGRCIEYQYDRFNWDPPGAAFNGRQFNDGTNNWSYVGTYYSFRQYQGTGTTCRRPDFMGPQYVLGAADPYCGAGTWIYNKYYFNSSDPFSDQSPPPVDPPYNAIYPMYSGVLPDVTTPRAVSARIQVPLSESTDPAVHDANLSTLFNRFNMPSVGGIATDQNGNYTPGGDGILLAHQHFYDRAYGQAPFSSPDSLRECRKRFVILLTDGKFNPGGNDPVDEIRNLYNDNRLSLPPDYDVKTYVICAFSSSPANRARCEDAADVGWDGVMDGVGSYFSADSESELIDALRSILLLALQGDFTTSSPGTTTVGGGSYGTPVEQNVVLLPSAEYPDWKGHLRAVNLTVDPPAELWDAGDMLDSRSWKTRKIYTGYPETNGGDPLPLFDYDALADVVTVNVADVLGAWPEWDTTPRPDSATITALVQWLAGKDRAWKLSPILLNVPATVGVPPRLMSAPGHNTFEAANSGREELLFVTSNEGLHAFRTTDGSEAYMFLPPDALPGLLALFSSGGLEPDPRDYRYVVARSVRVADIPDSSVSPVAWTTQLIMGLGPGGEHFMALDITSPSTCTGSTCTLDDPPFLILAHSKDDPSGTTSTSMGVDSYLGESWTVPAVFYVDDPGDGFVARASFGAGYPGGTRGDNAYNAAGRDDYKYHFSISDLWDNTDPGYLAVHNIYTAAGSTAPSAKVDYGIVANPIAINDPDTALVVSVYQADLAGQIFRYPDGNIGSATRIINVGTDDPIHYAPAGYYRSNGSVLLAFASGSFFEENAWMNDTSTFTSKIFLGGDNAGVYDNTEELECVINDGAGNNICTCAGFSSTPADCATLTPPSPRAKPVSQPVLVQSLANPELIRAYFVYYDPPPAPPLSCGGRVGSSWVFQINTEYRSATRKLVVVKQYEESFVSGLTSVGGGRDVAVIKSGIGRGQEASAELLSGEALPPAPPSILMEYRREVR